MFGGSAGYPQSTAESIARGALLGALDEKLVDNHQNLLQTTRIGSLAVDRRKAAGLDVNPAEFSIR
jgi:hypothetical protein